MILGQTVLEITTVSLCDEQTTTANNDTGVCSYHIRPKAHVGVLSNKVITTMVIRPLDDPTLFSQSVLANYQTLAIGCY